MELLLVFTLSSRSPDHRVPWWVRIWITKSPLAFLVLSVACFFVGLIAFVYASNQVRDRSNRPRSATEVFIRLKSHRHSQPFYLRCPVSALQPCHSGLHWSFGSTTDTTAGSGLQTSYHPSGTTSRATHSYAKA